MTRRTPTFRELSRDEIVEILQRNHVGRLAYMSEGRVDIEPLSYVWADGYVCGRTSPGTKVDALPHDPWCAFEVDEVRGPLDWASVVVKGTFHVVSPDPSTEQHATYAETLQMIRDATETSSGEGDQPPSRAILFRMFVEEARGRASEPK
jgi:nitroimidazol reductase NimA-like FMN-containing flavoprotein (pyridoxamine 5'-phosphate oxidase superfamily)